MADNEQQAGAPSPEGGQRERTEPGAPSLGATAAEAASASRSTTRKQPPGGRPGQAAFDDTFRQESPALTQAKLWVQGNQTVALLGAFALGTLIGVMMRR